MVSIFCISGSIYRLLTRTCGARHQKDSISKVHGAEKGDSDIEKNGAKLNSGPVEADFRPKDHYQHVKDLEQGDEGQCSVARSQTTGKLFVIKDIRPLKSKKQTTAEQTGRRRPMPNEAKILQRLPPHPNIIRFFGVEQSPLNLDRHIVFLEFCSGGDLLDQLRTFQKLRMRTPEIFTLHVLVNLAQALAYIHHGVRYKSGNTFDRESKHEPLIHGDIKPDNVFLRWPSRECGLPDVVLADFGMAQIASESWGITGTPGYDSPEVREVALLRHVDPAAFEKRRAARIMTIKSDIYQLGLVAHLLATGKHFEVGSDPTSIALPFPHQSITGLLAFMIWCLQLDPRDRPECTGNMEHGMLLAVDMFRKKRDARYAMTGELDKKIWNVSELMEESS